MNITVEPGRIDGSIHSPSSKSYMQRALAACLLADGLSTISRPSRCDDSRDAFNAIQSLGAKIKDQQHQIQIKGGFFPVSDTINVGESGLGIRMFSAISSLYNKPITISGSGTLLARPVNMIEEALIQLGVKCESLNGLPPITVQGPISGGQVELDGSISSQLLTGLLMTLPLAPNDSVIIVNNAKSKPYIDITIELLNEFGISIDNQNYEVFRIAGNQEYKSCNYTIEGDWSGASFLLVAGAIGGKISVSGLNNSSIQGDRQITKAIKMAGAQIISDNKSITVIKNQLNPFEFDATECPDLFPPLVSLAAHCNGKSILTGTSRLIYKESNRAEVLKKEFAKLNVRIDLTGDKMIVYGSRVSGGKIHANNDHRIAMAGAIAAISASGNITIEGAECVAKSYIDFFEDLQKITIK